MKGSGGNTGASNTCSEAGCGDDALFGSESSDAFLECSVGNDDHGPGEESEDTYEAHGDVKGATATGGNADV